MALAWLSARSLVTARNNLATRSNDGPGGLQPSLLSRRLTASEGVSLANWLTSSVPFYDVALGQPLTKLAGWPKRK